jgi:hypothetical protein
VSQTRLLDFHAARTAQGLNEKMRRATPAVLTEAMAVSKGTANFDVTLGAGAWISHEGIVVLETAAQDDLLTLADPDASDRIDVIYGTLNYEADTEPTPASYGVLTGTPGEVPVKPTPAADQIEIAAIYVPSDASDLDDCYVREVNPLKAWLAATVGLTIEANVFIRAIGDPFLATGNPTLSLIYENGIKNGDAWLEEAGLDLRFYNAGTNEWVGSDVASHASSHTCGASDPVDIKNLCDTVGYRHIGNKATHDALHLDHGELSNVTVNQHHAQNHNTRHHDGGADEVDVANLGDDEGYLHKHEGGVCPDPHGDDSHLNAYASDPHGHASHSGVMSRGQFGITTFTDAEVPLGTAIWEYELGIIEIEDTALMLTVLKIAVKTAPSQNLQYVLKLNGGTVATLTLVGGTYSITSDIEDVELEDGDVITLDGPAEGYGAKGFRVILSQERVAG